MTATALPATIRQDRKFWAERAGRAGRAALVASAVSRAPSPPALCRTNHRGRTVSLISGPALALAASSRSAPTAAVALGACTTGAYDDAVGHRPGQQAKGLAGHAAALRAGRLTSGAVKVVGLTTTGLLGTHLVGLRGADLLLAGAVVAGTANLVNLFDLRPGRALKVGLLASLALREPALAGATAALLPADLAERQMLGDAGAGALGAALGLALVERSGRAGLLTTLALVAALTGASEVVSFTRVIEATPGLRQADRLGRLPAAPDHP